MTRMSLCRSCSRHVRADETTCPFCGGAVLEPSGVSSPLAASLFKPGFSRAARLAAAAAFAGSAALGCAEEEITQPVYGAPVPNDAGSAGAAGTAGSGGQGGTGGEDWGQPVYGAPVEPPDASSNADAGGADAGEADGGVDADGGALDPGNLPQPVYGAPVAS